ncbi:MAG: class F sortase [Candidatus Saccharimonadales bacterium]
MAIILLATAAVALSWQYISPRPAAAPVASVPLQTTTGLPEKPSIDKTAQAKANHIVPATHPRQLRIPSISVDANIISLGVLADGSLAAPVTGWDVGWYDQSSLPGADDGALLMDGHVNNTLGTPGVFFDLHTVAAGDDIIVERGDGKLITYGVVNVEQKPIAQVDMSRMIKSATPGKQGLNIITCGGAYDHAKQTFVDRILVFAVQKP